jgi:hypothetical protein
MAAHLRPSADNRCYRCDGAKWWTEAAQPSCWRCDRCHPPPPGQKTTNFNGHR